VDPTHVSDEAQMKNRQQVLPCVMHWHLMRLYLQRRQVSQKRRQMLLEFLLVQRVRLFLALLSLLD
jgi:hypothetical protein